MLENMTTLALELEAMDGGVVGLAFVFYDTTSLDYTYNDVTDHSEEELREMAIKSAIEFARDSAPWVFRLDDGKVTEVIRVK